MTRLLLVLSFTSASLVISVFPIWEMLYYFFSLHLTKWPFGLVTLSPFLPLDTSHHSITFKENNLLGTFPSKVTLGYKSLDGANDSHFLFGCSRRLINLKRDQNFLVLLFRIYISEMSMKRRWRETSAGKGLDKVEESSVILLRKEREKKQSFHNFLGNETPMFSYGSLFRHILCGHFLGDVTLVIAAVVVIMSKT